MFIGCEGELAQLETLYASERAELFVLYGRRRVGKTELLRCSPWQFRWQCVACPSHHAGRATQVPASQPVRRRGHTPSQALSSRTLPDRRSQRGQNEPSSSKTCRVRHALSGMLQ